MDKTLLDCWHFLTTCPTYGDYFKGAELNLLPENPEGAIWRSVEPGGRRVIEMTAESLRYLAGAYLIASSREADRGASQP